MFPPSSTTQFCGAARASYTHEFKERLEHAHPDQRTQLETTLKLIDDEESRMARLLASGKVSEETWNSLWAEWQDRRQTIRRMLESMQQEQQIHVDNLDTALRIIAEIGSLHNGLQRSDKKELLRQIVERVIYRERRWKCDAGTALTVRLLAGIDRGYSIDRCSPRKG